MKLADALTVAAALGLIVLSEAPLHLQQPTTAADRFEVSDVMIPTRDGTKLHTKIFVPRPSTSLRAGNQAEALPIIVKRTPYGIEGSGGNFNAYFKALEADGYIFVFQDIRGKFGSEGAFVMQRPARLRPTASAGQAPIDDTTSIDEGTDTYDSIEWLLKNVRNHNGRVSMLGVSYDGWTTIMGAIEPHPALKAISPQASPADMWMGDDFHHNGAFRLSYGFEYAAMMESGKDVQQFSTGRSASTTRSNATTPRARTTWSWAPGGTVGGPTALATRSAPSPSAAIRRSTSATRCRRRSSRTS